MHNIDINVKGLFGGSMQIAAGAYIGYRCGQLIWLAFDKTLEGITRKMAERGNNFCKDVISKVDEERASNFVKAMKELA